MLDKDVEAALDEHCDRHGRSKKSVVNDLVRIYLMSPMVVGTCHGPELSVMEEAYEALCKKVDNPYHIEREPFEEAS